MPRLWVKKITSVGAVEEGDNPGAEIVFWKSAPTRAERVAKAINDYREVPMPNTTTETLTDACVEVVQKAAHEILLKDFGSQRGLSEEQIRAKLWRTEDGRALAALMRSPDGRRPVDAAVSEIKKSKHADYYSDGIRVLRDGLL